MHGINRCYHKTTSNPVVKICLEVFYCHLRHLEQQQLNFDSHDSGMNINGYQVCPSKRPHFIIMFTVDETQRNFRKSSNQYLQQSYLQFLTIKGKRICCIYVSLSLGL